MTRRELNVADYLAILRRHWVLIAILAVIGPPLGYGVAKLLPPKYTSQALVLIQEPTVSPNIVEPVNNVDVNQQLASMRQQILSPTRLEPIIRKLNLFPADIDHTPMDRLVERLQDEIDVSPVQAMAQTSSALPGFYVSVTMSQAQTAQAVCTAVTSMFIEESIKLQNQRSAQTTNFLSQQLSDAKSDLDTKDAQLAAFKTRYFGSLPDDEQTNLNILGSLSTQLDAATQAVSRAEQDKSFAQTMLNQQLATWQAAQTSEDPQTMQQELVALQTKLANLLTQYTNNYPDVIRTKADIAALKTRLAAADTTAEPANAPASLIQPTQILELRAQIKADDQMVKDKTKEQQDLKRQIALYQTRVQSSPMIEQQYKELTRGYQTALETYNDLLKKREASEMSQALNEQDEGELFSLLDPANLPDSPSFPKIYKFVLGGLAAGLALGLGITFLLEMKDTSMRTERDVEFALRLPVLAMIPAVQPSSGKSQVAIGKSPGVDRGPGLVAKA
jgi:polysaccharide chain length determinant protein (PEP-CTERM system associated)